MTDIGNEYHRYVTQLEEQNEAMRAMVDARDLAHKSITAEAENLRRALDKACRRADETARELDLMRGMWMKVGAASDEIRRATAPAVEPAKSPRHPIDHEALRPVSMAKFGADNRN